ncbi:MAG: hypothetical protein PHH36_03500 [Sideroxydans sp.]|nr:hypothetical protein [Sideroxydans sp.]
MPIKLWRITCSGVEAGVLFDILDHGNGLIKCFSAKPLIRCSLLNLSWGFAMSAWEGILRAMRTMNLCFARKELIYPVRPELVEG